MPDRFTKLIQDEFGVDVPAKAQSEDAAHAQLVQAAPKARRHRDAAAPAKQWFSLDKAIDAAEPDHEPFVPPPGPPLSWPRRPLVWIGLACLLGAVGVGIAWGLAAPLPIWLRWAGGVGVGAGLACLLLSLPRHREEPLDDGAVV